MLLVGAVVAIVSLLAGGCGSDDGDKSVSAQGSGSTATDEQSTSTNQGGESAGESTESSETDSLTFAKQARGICKKGYLATQAEAGQLQGGGVPSAQAFAQAVVPAYKKALEEMEALELPEDEQEAAEAFLAALGEGLDQVEERSESVKTIEEVEEPLAEAGELAVASGIPTCAFGS